MKLDNTTRYQALLVRSGLDSDTMLGALVARITYEIVGQALRIADDQSLWKVSLGPWDGPHGQMPGDELFYREGVDVMVFGSARAPRGESVTRLDVEIRVGARWRGRVAVFGDRVWQRRDVQLVAGPPRPFRAMPLDLAHAFGGADTWDEAAITYPDNPDGRGFYLSAERAEGQPLPNLEDPAAPIVRWDDRPEPVGTGVTPLQFGPRLRLGIEVDEEKQAIRKLHPIVFNAAFPQMIAPSAAPGERVVISGVDEGGPLVFTLPATPVRVQLRFGDEHHVRTPAIEQIGVEVDARRVFITYRFPFRYDLVRMQLRGCRLVLADG
jgi:hypothetical protein